MDLRAEDQVGGVIDEKGVAAVLVDDPGQRAFSGVRSERPRSRQSECDREDCEEQSHPKRMLFPFAEPAQVLAAGGVRMREMAQAGFTEAGVRKVIGA